MLIFLPSFRGSLKIVGDDTPAIESVLKADVWRDRLMAEEKELNVQLSALETEGDGSRLSEEAKEAASVRLAEVHQKLADIDAETGPVRNILFRLTAKLNRCIMI